MHLRGRKVLVPLMGIILMASAAGAIYAETASVTITGGALTVTASNVTLPGVTLNGVNQTPLNTPAGAPWTAVDARGTGAGWHLTLIATDFVGGTPTRTIDIADPISRFRIIIPSISPGAGASAGPTNLVLGTTVIPDILGLTIVSANANTGMGTYTFTPEFSLTTLASTYAEAYTATITVTAVNGP